jgi:hypothetical protein
MTSPPGGHFWTWLGAAILVGALAVAAAAAWWLQGAQPGGPQAIGFAAAVCLAGSLGGWLLARRPQRTPAAAVAGGLGAVAMRIMLPLATLAWLQVNDGPMTGAGAATLLLVFYLVMLATDIALHVAAGRMPRVDRGGERPN